MATNKVFYSFLHRNEDPYTATGYYVYRQDISGGTTGPFNQIATLIPTGKGNPINVSGVDDVPACGVTYNYKCSAINAQGQAMGLNPVYSGISFPCPTPTPSVTRTPAISPSSSVALTPTASVTATPSVTPTITPSLSVSNTPDVTPSITPTITNSVTITPTLSPTASVSTTPAATPSATPTITPSLSTSSTPAATPSATPTITPSLSTSSTPAATPSATPTITPSLSSSSTPAPTPSVTPTITNSVTATPTLTPTASVSTTPAATPSVTPTVTPSPPSSSVSRVLINLTVGSSELNNLGIKLNDSNFTAAVAWPAGATGFRILDDPTPGGDYSSTYFAGTKGKPDYYEDPAGTYYISDFGLIKCTDASCGSYDRLGAGEAVALSAGNNDPIAIFASTYTSLFASGPKLPQSAIIRFSGEWLS